MQPITDMIERERKLMHPITEMIERERKLMQPITDMIERERKQFAAVAKLYEWVAEYDKSFGALATLGNGSLRDMMLNGNGALATINHDAILTRAEQFTLPKGSANLGDVDDDGDEEGEVSAEAPLIEIIEPPTMPPSAERLLAWLMPADMQEAFFGCLEERFHQRAATDGPKAARWWYWWQIFIALWPLVFRLFTRAEIVWEVMKLRLF
jgi:hypothetical protein